MTKKELIKMNKQAAYARMQESPEYKEAQRMIDICNEAGERGDHKESSRAHYRSEKLLREARKHLRAK